MRARTLKIVLVTCVAVPVQAQRSCRDAPPILVGSEWEQYLRVAQISGLLPLQPWTIRDFGPQQWDALALTDTTLPWATSLASSRITCIGSLRAQVIRVRLRMVHNSAFPYGENDGAVWAGRGVTVAAEGGMSARYGPLTLTFAPLIFAAQNESFAIQPTGAGNSAFADWRNPGTIDLPQRFGDARYAAFDLGESSIRIDARAFAMGVSTAHQFWGPATDHPIILGDNAAGFPHLFVGSARPLRIGRLGDVHGRVFWGKLDQSRYSAYGDSSTTRLGSGIAVVFQPSGIRGLEIGGGRFFHVLQDRWRLDRGEILRPFGAILKVARARQIGSATGDEPDNQLGSVFARYVLPGDGAEFYGEYGREDHSFDTRDFLLMPDHDAAYLLGMRKLWRRRGSVSSLRAEVLNSRVTHLALSSSQVPWYVHASVRQGHTNKGQALGSAAAYGGGASVFAFERYTYRGRWGVKWERIQFGEHRQFRAPDVFLNDVAHSVGVSVLRFGRRADIEAGVSAVYEFNRHFSGDARNLQTTISIRPRSLRFP